MKKMMLKFSAIILLACFSTACQNNSGKPSIANDLMTANLQGKVQRSTETSVSFDSTGTVQKGDASTEEMLFDERGFQTRVISKRPGIPESEMTFTRFASGALKEAVFTDSGKLTFRTVNEIDSNGNPTGSKNFDSTGKLYGYTKIISANEYGMPTSSEHYGLNNKFRSSMESKYDKARYLGWVVKDSAGKTTMTLTLKLNEKGEPKEQVITQYLKDSSKTDRETYQYGKFDVKGNWTERTSYTEKGMVKDLTRRTLAYYKD